MSDNNNKPLSNVQEDDDDDEGYDGYQEIHVADSDTVGTAAHVNTEYHDLQYEGDEDDGGDATNAIHEMHLALLYLLSNPEEFQKAMEFNTNIAGQNRTTLAQWNADYEDNESLYTEVTASASPDDPQQQQQFAAAGTTASLSSNPLPLPYAVFCDDAEIVLPQAHTASQLFGLELKSGMELEAAAGIPQISQLFLRWLALMPQGDHLNLVDPPGLTVMKIAGGRYRVTAAHRVVWTWRNEFVMSMSTGSGSNRKKNKNTANPVASEGTSTGHHHQPPPPPPLKMEDLVAMTIIDVFETDSHGKLLSYCPTFDNRQVQKIDRTSYLIRKQTTQFKHHMSKIQNSSLAKAITKHLTSFAVLVKQKVHQSVSGEDDDGVLLPADDQQHNDDDINDHHNDGGEDPTVLATATAVIATATVKDEITPTRTESLSSAYTAHPAAAKAAAAKAALLKSSQHRHPAGDNMDDIERHEV